MARRTFVVVALAGIGALAACVDVPDSMKAQFAAPAPTEKSNYRPGAHGSAPPVAETPALPPPPVDAGVVDAPDAAVEGGSV